MKTFFRKGHLAKSGKRWLALLMSACLIGTMTPVTARAESGSTETGLCEHHTEHTAECGYVAPIEGHECEHVHDESCGYQEASECTHVHTEECGENGENCTHVHDDECGYAEGHVCEHVHDEECGYVESSEGSPCTFACDICGKEAEPGEGNPPETVEGSAKAEGNLQNAGGKMISDWEWVDEWEIIDPDSGKVLLPFANKDNVAGYDDIIMMLPVAIMENEEELSLGEWLCPGYPVETGAYEGEYVFETTLPEGCVLEDGSNTLYLSIVLGDPEGEPAVALTISKKEPPTGTHIIGDAEVTAYELSTKEHLYWFADAVNSGNNSINAVLLNDIKVNDNVLNSNGDPNGSNFEAWSPIGNWINKYVGKFDGQGYAISGLYHKDQTVYAGLFGVIGGGAYIRRLGVVDSYFKCENGFVGGFCGTTVDEDVKPRILECYTTATVYGNGASTIGGFCGSCNSVMCYLCFSAGKVGGESGSSTGPFFGGVAFGQSATNCYALSETEGSDYGVAYKTDEQFQSGEVAYYLTHLRSSVWGQTLGTDAIPRLFGKPVFSTPDNEYHNHEDDVRFCIRCGEIEPTNDGTYYIKTAEQLYWFAALVNGTDGLSATPDARARLLDNITVGDDWVPIGNGNAFTGKFDTTYNRTISGIPAGSCLFGTIGSGVEIYKLAVSGGGGLCASNNGAIDECSVSDSGSLVNSNAGMITNCTVTGTGNAALCSGINTGTIKECSVTGGDGTKLCSTNTGSGIITNCYVLASGIGSVALCSGTNSAVFANCYASGGEGTKLYGSNSGIISNCYYLAGSTAGAAGGENIAAEDFTCGRVAYLLNQGTNTYPGGVWGQTIGTDSTPLPGSMTVYYNENATPKYHNHYKYCDICNPKPEFDGWLGVWKISNLDELYWYAAFVKGTVEGYEEIANKTIKSAVLTQDITVNEGVLNPDGTLSDNKDSFVQWEPIGDIGQATFDGQNHTISGLYIDTENNDVGLFSYLYKGTVKNLTIADSYIRGKQKVGAVCGRMDEGKVINCMNRGTVSGDFMVGGVCGRLWMSEASNCANTGVVSGGRCVGGVLGQVGKTNASGCYNVGKVIGTDLIAGICGNAYNESQIQNCYHNTDINNISAVNGDTCQNVEGKSTEAFAGGEVAFLLNGSTSDGEWKQNIDSGTPDDIPRLTGNKVYKTVEGSPCVGYTNKESGIKEHRFENHSCIWCAESDQIPITVSGITANDKVYDGNTTAILDYTGVTLSGVASGDDVSVRAIGTFANKGVGQNITVNISGLTLTGTDADKYCLEESGQQTGTAAGILAKDITVTITQNGGAYGNVTPAAAQTVGVVSGDTVPVTLTYTGTANDGTDYNSTTPPSKAGTYTVTASISNGNYNLTGTVTEQFVVDKAVVTTPGALGSKSYNGEVQTPDILSTALYKLPESAGEKNAGDHEVTLVLKDTDNYQWDDGKGKTSFTITQKSLIVKAADKSVTYGDSAPTYTAGYTGFVDGEDADTIGLKLSFSCTYRSGSPVSSESEIYDIGVEGTAASNNYRITYNSGILTVKPKAVTVTITPNGGTYGDVTPATAAIPGLLDGDDIPVTLTYTGTANDGTTYDSTTVPEKAGTYTVTATVAATDPNYAITDGVDESFVIAKATVATPKLLDSKVYNGTAQSPDIASDALFELATPATGKDVGNYPANLRLKDTDNYQWDTNNGCSTFRITKKALTVTANNLIIDYCDPVPAYTASCSGFVAGEDENTIGLKLDYSCSYRVGSAVNEDGYDIMVSGSMTSDNYKITYLSGKLYVIPKDTQNTPISLTVNDEKLIYTGSALTPEVTVTWGDKTLVQDTDYTVSYVNNVNAGEDTAKVIITTRGNYKGIKSANFSIGRAPLTVTAKDYTIAYGDAVPTYTAECTGFVAGEDASTIEGNLVFTCTYQTGSPVTEEGYEIRVSSSTAPKNYEITYMSGRLYVTPKDVKDSSIMLKVNGTNLIYTGAAQTPEVAVTWGDKTLVQDTDYTVSYENNVNSGENTARVIVTAKGNYKGTKSVNFSIDRASLTVTAKDYTITYGDTPRNAGVTYSGFVNGENESVLSGSPDYTYSYSRFDDAGSSYTITPAGLTSDNYDITFESGTLTVLQKIIDIKWSNTKLNYTGSAQMPTAVATNVVNGDTLTLTVTGKKTNPGTYSARVTGITGDNASNYRLPADVSVIFTIKSVDTGEKDDGNHTEQQEEPENTTSSQTPAIGNTSVVTESPAVKQEALTEKTNSTPGTENGNNSFSKPGINTDENNDENTEVPFIKGVNGKEGWDIIRDEVTHTQAGKTVTVDMNSSTVVPGNVLDEIKGKDVTIVFDMGNGITWSVNGQSITGDKIGDIDFSVTVGTDTIPVDIINNVTGERYGFQISLAYDGEFDFTAVLSINMGADNAGLYANLFYYNEKTGELEFICADEIAEDGTAELVFTHASDYTIVMDKRPMDVASNDTADTNTDASGTSSESQDTETESTQTGAEVKSDAWNPWWIIVIGIMAIVIGLGVFFVAKKKKEDVE